MLTPQHRQMLKIWLWNSLCMPCVMVLFQFLAEPLSKAAYNFGLTKTRISSVGFEFTGEWSHIVALALFAGLIISGIQLAATWFSLFALFKRRRRTNSLCLECMAWTVGPGFCLAVALSLLCGFVVLDMEYSGLVIMCLPAGLYALRFKAKDTIHYDTHKPRLLWWWWTTLVFGVLVLALILLSFTWKVEWTDAERNWCVYYEHGMLVGILNFGTLIASNPNLPWPTGELPWYGCFQVHQSNVYEPWALLPTFDLANDYFKCPVHLVALVIVPILAYPFLSPVFFIQRYRRKEGCCLKCGYSLEGNVSGVCPECGERI